MMPESERLLGILQGLSNESKEVRDASEQAYEQEWLTRPQLLFPSLFDLLSQCENPVVILVSILNEIYSFGTDPSYCCSDVEKGSYEGGS